MNSELETQKKARCYRLTPAGVAVTEGLLCVAIAILLCMLVLLLGVAPAFAQEKPSAESVRLQDSGGVHRTPETGVQSVDKPLPAPVKVPADLLELLDARQVLLREIERIDKASGEVVIHTPRVDLVRISEKLWARYEAWLDANKIPREWRKAGWTYEPKTQTFTPPRQQGAGSGEQGK